MDGVPSYIVTIGGSMNGDVFPVAPSAQAPTSNLSCTNSPCTMPHPIIEISELTQLVADHLLTDGKQSLVSLASTCRALEEQALSTLWSEQSLLDILIICTLPPGMSTPWSAQWPPQVCNGGRYLAHF